MPHTESESESPLEEKQSVQQDAPKPGWGYRLASWANWLLTHTLYRIQVQGKENVPKTGGALLVCNHVAYVDPPLLLASIGRPIRFLMFRQFYEATLLNPIVKLMRAIPISESDSPKDLVRSLKEARAAVENGEVVCIFAEGELTRIGRMLSFKKGFERIMHGLDAPVIPVYIDQIWGSIFSFRNGRFFWKFPKQIPYPVTISIGKPLPASVKAHQVRQSVQEMSAELAIGRRKEAQTLHRIFIRSAHFHPFRTALIDTMGRRLRFFPALIASIALARKLQPQLSNQKMVGLMLPSSVGGALCNIALALLGKTSVNINFTAGQSSMDSAREQAELKTVISSRSFLARAKIEPLPGTIYLEDILPSIGTLEKGVATLLSLLPGRFLENLLTEDGRNVHPDELATIIFSSGSTGEPKGVSLSHGNISSNIQALYELFDLDSKDGVMGVLPFFHSFGYTGTLWLPLLVGIRAVYHPNPMDAGTIGDWVERERLTILMSTPTFLQAYTRKCPPSAFASLRYLVVGAEKLKERVAAAFHEKFGIIPLEGYGCTELSPVALLNVPDVSDGRVNQKGHKPGTAGHPIPRVAVRIADPETLEPMPMGAEGVLLVRGPNVMMGYLKNEKKTSEVVRDGWYVTGDIAKLDEDGFVTITDRLARFSKIGGEMVPHGKIEEAVHSILESSETVCVVTALPDEKKGEKIVLLLNREVESAWLVGKLGDQGLPNLWIPKKENIFVVDAFPFLGTGKIDLKGIKAKAQELHQKLPSSSSKDSESA